MALGDGVLVALITDSSPQLVLGCATQLGVDGCEDHTTALAQRICAPGTTCDQDFTPFG